MPVDPERPIETSPNPSVIEPEVMLRSHLPTVGLIRDLGASADKNVIDSGDSRVVQYDRSSVMDDIQLARARHLRDY